MLPQRRRKLVPDALRQHIRDYPEARLQDRAQDFGVHPRAMGFALQRHCITVFKNSSATVSATIGNDQLS